MSVEGSALPAFSLGLAACKKHVLGLHGVFLRGLQGSPVTREQIGKSSKAEVQSSETYKSHSSTWPSSIVKLTHA